MALIQQIKRIGGPKQLAAMLGLHLLHLRQATAQQQHQQQHPTLQLCLSQLPTSHYEVSKNSSL